MRRSPARLVIALSVAAALAVFIIYTSIAGAGVPQILPSAVHKYAGKGVVLVGTVVSTRGDAHTADGMRLVLRDPTGTGAARVPVVYHGSVPDLYKVGRTVVVNGTYEHGTFVAENGSLSTKCPSKYSPQKSSNT
ncbi:MAG: cytochrome c maturation protein CcmE [Actinomycetota bacterium]